MDRNFAAILFLPARDTVEARESLVDRNYAKPVIIYAINGRGSREPCGSKSLCRRHRRSGGQVEARESLVDRNLPQSRTINASNVEARESLVDRNISPMD